MVKTIRAILSRNYPDYKFFDLEAYPFDADIEMVGVEIISKNLPDHVTVKKTLNMAGDNVKICTWSVVNIDDQGDVTLKCKYVFPDIDDELMNVRLWDKYKNSVATTLNLNKDQVGDWY